MDFGPGGPLNNVGAIGDAVPIRNGAVGENAGQPPGAQLPDLDMLQRIFQAQAGFDMQLANEMPKFRNLQAAGNDGIVAKLRDLRATIQDMNNTIKGMNNTLNGMNNAINDTRGQVDATYNEVRGLRIDMYARTSAKDFNSAARIYNASIRSADVPLAKFKNVQTNDWIPGFPDTGAALSDMGIPELDGVMRALNLPIPQGIDEKKKNLRFHIGLSDTSGR